MNSRIEQFPQTIKFPSSEEAHQITTKTIDDLPNQMILEIFAHLNTIDLIALSTTSRRFKELSSQALDRKGYDLQANAYQMTIESFSSEIRQAAFGKKDIKVHINNIEDIKFYEDKIEEMSQLVNLNSENKEDLAAFSSDNKLQPSLTQKIGNCFLKFFY